MLELFMIIRNISEIFPFRIPVELCFLMMKSLILVWPESHYVTRIKEEKKESNKKEIQ